MSEAMKEGRGGGCQARCGGVGEASGAFDAERGRVTDGPDGVPPQLAVVGQGVCRVEDTTVGGVVEELHGSAVRYEIFALDLVPEVYA